MFKEDTSAIHPEAVFNEGNLKTEIALIAISLFACNLTWNSLVRQWIFLYNPTVKLDLDSIIKC